MIFYLEEPPMVLLTVQVVAHVLTNSLSPDPTKKMKPRPYSVYHPQHKMLQIMLPVTLNVLTNSPL